MVGRDKAVLARMKGLRMQGIHGCYLIRLIYYGMSSNNIDFVFTDSALEPLEVVFVKMSS